MALPLLALEIFLRIGTRSLFLVPTSGLIVESGVPGLGYRLAANYSQGTILTDEFGFRRPPQPRPLARRSILLLGDSVAFGGGVPYEAGLGAILENQLSRDLGQQIAVWNAAVPGYNSVQESILFEDLRKKVKPDLVMVEFCMNDYLEPVTLTPSGKLDTTESPNPRISLTSVLYRSRAVFFLKEEIKNLEKLHPEWFPVPLHYIHHIQKRPGWRNAKNAIRQIANISRQMHVPFLLVIFPVEQQLRIHDRAPQADLVAFAQSEGISVLDLYSCMVGHWREHLFFDFSVEERVVDKIHLSRRGHVLAGREIAAGILRDPVLRSALQ